MSKGRFGIHGGQYIPETLMNAVIELEEAYNHYKDDPEFNAELTELLNEYAGRPSRLYFASHMTEDLGGAKVYLKREDLNHTGAHKINNVIGQALLAKRMGAKKAPFYRVIVADSRSPRDGRFIDTIGTYNPLTTPAEIKLNEESAIKWLNNGAIPTDTVKNLFSKAGIMEKYHNLKQGK